MLLYHLGSILARFEIVTIVSTVLGADNAKSDDFDLWPDPDLACDLLKIFNSLIKYSLRAFDCRLAHLAKVTVAGLRVSKGGGG